VVAIVPVKSLRWGKSRLALPDEQRKTLALAFALDTIAALLATPVVAGVLVVSADADVVRRLRHTPVRLVPDDGSGLPAAIRAGSRAAASWMPERGVAVVPADLPCVCPEDVTQVLLSEQSADGAFVPDRTATGTTMLMSPPGRPAAAAYGRESAARHLALGLRRLDEAPVAARHDVDTLEDLRLAAVLGVGAQTVAALAGMAGFTEVRGTLNGTASALRRASWQTA
jgi:2-phospho-L-lactate guanylyltransferase